VDSAAADPTAIQRRLNATVAHVVAAALRRHSVNVVFGQSIPSALFMATPEYHIRQVGYRTENAGGAMADGYARVSGKVGVVAAQNGPAAALLVPPLAEAMKASVPIVALIQDVARTTVDRNAFQELDHLDMFHCCTKWVRRLDQADRADDYVDMAFAAAASGRPGPAALLLPMDLLREPAQISGTRRLDLGTFPLDRVAPGPDRINSVVGALLSAKRPYIVAGGGVHLSGATAPLAELSRLAAIPVATTNMGKGAFDETFELSAGLVGNCMGRGTIGHHLGELLREADLVLLVGTRTNQNGTDNWTLFPKTARYIHIDIDPLEIGRNYEAERLVGDVKLTLELLCRAVRERDNTMALARKAPLSKRISTGWNALRQDIAAIGGGRSGAIRPEWVMSQLDALLGPRDVVVADASYATNWVTAYLTAKTEGMRFLSPRGLAGLGWGLPMALGAKLARPDSRVFAIVGDGGFGHCWSELETARRAKLTVITIVLNNGILGYQAHAENVHYGDHTDACEFHDVDHAAIARACGCYAERVAEPSEIGPALRRAMDLDGFVLIEVMTDAAAFPPLSVFEGKSPWTTRHDEALA
jgi:acetolactate synthase I/II/III large subunit